MTNISEQDADLGTAPTSCAATTSDPTAALSSRPVSSGAALLNVLAVPLGVVGLAGAWQALRTSLHEPAWPDEVLFAIGTAMWLAVTVVYLVRGVPRPAS